MISPELLRQYPHFAGASEELLKEIALIGDKVGFTSGEDLFTEGNTATHFCLVLSGDINIVYRLGDDREVVADTLVKGDAFAWSSLLEPHRLTASCRGNKAGEFIKIDADKLRQISEKDHSFGYVFIREIARLLRDRLSALRVQIAAAR